MAAELVQIYRNETDQSRTLIYPRTIADNVYITPTLTLSAYIKNLNGDSSSGDASSATASLVNIKTYGEEDNKETNSNNSTNNNTITYNTGVVPKFIAQYNIPVEEVDGVLKYTYKSDDKNPEKNVLRADGKWILMSDVVQLPPQQYHVASIQALVDANANQNNNTGYINVFPLTSSEDDMPKILAPWKDNNDNYNDNYTGDTSIINENWFAGFMTLEHSDYSYYNCVVKPANNSVFEKHFSILNPNGYSNFCSYCTAKLNEAGNYELITDIERPRGVQICTKLYNIKENDIIYVYAKTISTGEPYYSSIVSKANIYVDIPNELDTSGAKPTSNIISDNISRLVVSNSNIKTENNQSYIFLNIKEIEDYDTQSHYNDARGMNIIFDIYVIRK